MQHLNKDIKVTKDFLLKNDFDNIFRLASSSDFSWFYQPEHNPNAKDGFFFSHCVYNRDRVNSDHYDRIIGPLARRIKYNCLARVFVNFLTRSDTPRRAIFHRDFDDERMTTGILYLNETNGYTEFETGEKIKSIPNMYVEFPTRLKHRGVSQTDKDGRIIINLNYYK